MRERNQQTAVLEAVFNETRSLFHRLKVVAEEVHKGTGITAGMRGVLESLAHLGPQTVPEMARARPVSRQHIQTIVNALYKRRHVEFAENPAHKKSQLVQLTVSGKKLIEKMKRREAQVLSKVVLGVTERDLVTTARTLQTVKTYFAGNQWERILKQYAA